jgi:hypothetical protein
MPPPSQDAWRPPPDDTALVPPVLLHVEVAAVSNGEDVRGQLTHVVTVVKLHLLQGVEGQHLEWVHGHQDGACVCLGKEQMVSTLNPRAELPGCGLGLEYNLLRVARTQLLLSGGSGVCLGQETKLSVAQLLPIGKWDVHLEHELLRACSQED